MLIFRALCLTVLGLLPALSPGQHHTQVTHDLFSSSDELVKVYAKIQRVKDSLAEQIGRIERKLEKLDRYLDMAEPAGGGNSSSESATAHVSNPLNTFQLLKRVSVFWPAAKSELADEAADQAMAELEKGLELLPQVVDVDGAANGLFLLHETYNLNLTRLARGEVEVPGQPGRVIRGRAKLRAYHMDTLGKLAFNRGFYDNAVEWLEAAIDAARADPLLSREYGQELERTAAVMKKKHDAVLDQKGPRGVVGKQSWRTFNVPFDAKLARKKKYKKVKERRYRIRPKLFKRMEQDELWDNFNALCRGERLREPEMDKDLLCFHLHYADPYLRLGPFKLEQKNVQPFMGVLHDFLHDDEIRAYLETVSGKLFRSMHQGKKLVGVESGQVSMVRTSSQTWLGEHLNPSARIVSDRIKLATRLHVHEEMGGEQYQVANYGIGGVYNHHMDSNGKNVELDDTEDAHKMWGDRIATTMGYLSDVKAGGATVFPALGITVWPERGSLAFWFNNDRNDQQDMLTHHGGCPVLVGSKWITNKWIRAYAQMWNFPTLPDPLAPENRMPAPDNDVCKMTHRCDVMDLYPKKMAVKRHTLEELVVMGVPLFGGFVNNNP